MKLLLDPFTKKNGFYFLDHLFGMTMKKFSLCKHYAELRDSDEISSKEEESITEASTW